MSRIGKQPVIIPDNVTIKLETDGISVAGPKGSLKQFPFSHIKYQLADQQCLVQRSDDSKIARSQHGLARSLVLNMVTGVTQGFEKQLEIVGIGYKVRLEAKTLILNLGFSHEISYLIPEGIEVTVEGNFIKITGIDKQQVGQVAATIRNFRKPEPYKGKGIRYRGEKIRRKSGKGAKEA